MGDMYHRPLVLDREETIRQYNKFIQERDGKSKHYKLREAADGWDDEELISLVRRNGFEPIFRRG